MELSSGAVPAPSSAVAAAGGDDTLSHRMSALAAVAGIGAWLFDRFPCLIPSNPAAEVDCCVCVCASADRWLVGLGGWQDSVRRLGWLIDERVVATEGEEDDFSDCGLLFRGPR